MHVTYLIDSMEKGVVVIQSIVTLILCTRHEKRVEEEKGGGERAIWIF